MVENDKLTLSQLRAIRNLSPRLAGFECLFEFGNDANIYITHPGVYQWCITPSGDIFGRAVD